MKNFFSQYSYSMLKMFINQFAIGIFGAVLALAAQSTENDVLTIIVSVFSVLFYLFLIYNMTWEIGAKDRLAVDYKKQAYRPHKGLVLSLFANIPNYLIAVLFTVTAIFSNTAWAEKLRTGTMIGYFVIEGMYTGLCGLITIPVNGVMTSLNSFWWNYFLITLPSLFTAWLAYFLGHKNFRFTALFGGGAKPEQGNKKS